MGNYETIPQSDGGCYNGEVYEYFRVVNGRRWRFYYPHGEGMLTKGNGTTCRGTFVHKKFVRGIRRLASGEVQEGSFSEGSIVKGTVKFPDGHICSGSFVNASLEGKGIWLSTDKSAKYEGQFKSGSRHGSGVLTEKDGSKYVGQFQNGKFHGKGTRTYSNGNIYIGDFSNGKSHGIGLETHSDARRYQGGFSNGNRSGKGVYTWSTGQCYDGEWKDNLKHGVGKFTYADGRVYTGKFVEDLRCGHGVFQFRDGNTYEGEWQNDLYHGTGKQSQSNGVYEGCFVTGLRHGRGRFTFKNGDVTIGSWNNGKQHGFCKCIDVNNKSKSKGVWGHGKFLYNCEREPSMLDGSQLLFGLQPQFTEQDLRRAYKATALKYHPDKNATEQAWATEMFKDVQAAHEFLKQYAKSNPENSEERRDKSSKSRFSEDDASWTDTNSTSDKQRQYYANDHVHSEVPKSPQFFISLFSLSTTSTADDLRRIYKELIVQYHPDKNPDNIEWATAMFKEIQVAYRILKMRFVEDSCDDDISNPDHGATAAAE